MGRAEEALARFEADRAHHEDSRRRRAGGLPAWSRPWTAAEDEKLREITRIGLSNDFWESALPERPFGEICARRLELGLERAAEI